MNGFELTEVVEGYMACAIWAENDEEAGIHDGLSLQDFTPAARRHAEQECRDFCESAKHFLERAKERGFTPAQIGHDLWLTRRGHGAGFWDRDELKEGNLGQQISALCENADCVTLELGDDGRLHFFGESGRLKRAACVL